MVLDAARPVQPLYRLRELLDCRSAQALPAGVYFGKVFLRCGSLKQTEIVVHEGTHFVNTSMTGDDPNPTSPEGDARYRSQPAEHAIKNTHAYNLFAAQCVFGHPRRIAQEE